MSQNSKEKKNLCWKKSDVRYLSAEEKRRTIPLWESCFPEDSREFLEYYYTEKTKENRIAVIEKEGEILSMLHRNPYRLHVKGQIWESDYLVAVATRKDCRGKGAMRAVLTKILEDMNREKMPFTFLMPAAEGIYTPYDFAFVSEGKKYKLKEENVQYVPVEKTEELEKAARRMKDWLQTRFEVFTERNKTYAEQLKREVESEQGQLRLLCREGRTAGVQAFWGSEKQEQRLLYAPDELCEIQAGNPLIMGRITELQTFLTAFSLKKKGKLTVLLEAEDRWIPENSGRFLWELTETSSTVTRQKTALQAAEAHSQVYLRAKIGQLAQWLMGYREPGAIWTDLPVQTREQLEQIQTVQGVWIDEVV